MHLNRDCRFPDLSNLFTRTNVTAAASSTAATILNQAVALQRMLAGPLPSVAYGDHCDAPYECVFKARCWPATPAHHVSTLYRIRKTKAAALAADGYETLLDLPAKFKASGPAQRQVDGARSAAMIVEPGLGNALATIVGPVAFLDFETIAPAIPVWNGCGPYDAVPVQFSCHVTGMRGPVHHAWLAEGPADPREAIAIALLAACEGATTIVAYNAPFEKKCISELAIALPALAAALTSLNSRFVDLLPIVRDHVYHPEFGGSFSIKAVLPALVPGLGYDDLEIADGMAASAALEEFLLRSDGVPEAETAAQRAKLLAYCERDTFAMVRLYEQLREIAAG